MTKEGVPKQQCCILQPMVLLLGEFAMDHPWTATHSVLVGKTQEKGSDGNQETRSCYLMGTLPDQSEKIQKQYVKNNNTNS
jgi:hypothetical protein